MNGITHKQAKNFMNTELDGLLTDAQRRDLDVHLRECDACRLEAESLSVLTARLQSSFHGRWGGQDGPSDNVLRHVLSQKGRIIMSNRITSGFKVFTGIVALLVLGFLVNLVVAQIRDHSIASSATQINAPVSPDKRLIAFTSTDDTGNSDIYIVHPDGSGLTNLTNNPAFEINPFWSPDGTRIAFQSDRTGLMQVFVMNADGSHVVQLTNNEVNHELMSVHGPWSPDGKKLLFTEWRTPDFEKWKLYAIGVDGKNKTHLADVPPVYTSPFWSPDGKHVAFVSDSRLYVVDSNGNNLTEITKSLPPGEVMDSYNPPNYYWAPDGQSIIFIASNVDSRAQNQGGEPNLPFTWKVYEASLDGRTLISNTTTRSPIGGWWQGNYFVTPFVDVRPWTWASSNGVRTVDPFANCKDLSGGGYRFIQSLSGNVAIGAMCPNGDWWLFMVNPQGIMSPLMTSPIPTTQGSMDRIAWSGDDKFISFNITSNEGTEMYMGNVAEALKNPSIPPVHLRVGNIQDNYLPSWQPIPNNNIVEEKPTPEPTPAPSYDRLIAFVSRQDGNEEIYTRRMDVSDLANLTNNLADDANPFWSPDGGRIAFESERDGNLEIYMMNFDGSGLTRLTNDSANDILNDGWSTSQAWSPDGTRILYRNDHNGKWDLFVARTDGSGAAQLTRDGDPAADGGFFWSPDGRKVAYAVGWATGNQPQVYVINTDGSNRQQMPIPKVAFGFELSGWSADGQALYYNASDCAPNNSGECGFPRTSLYRGALDGSDPVLLATASDNVLGWVIQPNRNVLYFKDKTPFMATTLLGVDDWIWWEVVNDNPTQLNEWSNLQEKCQTPDIDSVQITHTAYADWPGAEKQMLVAVYCGKDDQTWLYLVNADGSKHQLLNSTALPAMVDMLRLSVDGHLVLLSRSDSTDQTIYVLDLFAAQQDPGVRPVRLTAPNDVRVQPVPFSGTFSVNPAPTLATTPTAQNSLPISKHNLIAFTREEVLYVMQSDGQGLQRLTTGSLSVGSPQWSPDGKQISFQGIENNVIGLYLIGLDGNGPTRLADGGSSAAWSPDGQQIASFVLDYQNPAESRLEIINADGSNLRTVPLKTVNGELDMFNPNVRWSADGKYVQFLMSKFTGGIPYSKSDRWTIYQTSVESGSLKILRESKIPILNWYGNATDLTYITVDEDKNELQWVQNQSVLSTWNLPIYTPMVTSWWSTDHHKLLIAMENGSGTEVQLLLADAGSVDFKQIADHLSFNGYLITPSWSPDGRHIVFSSDLESPGNHDIYTLDIQAALNDPATLPIRLTTSGFGEYEPTWQPQP